MSAPELLSVLVVEDYPDGAESMRELLAVYGFDTRVARSVAEGLRAAADFRPDVVLLDIQLPDGTGYDLAGRLRGLLTPRPVFVAITGLNNLEETSRREGVDHHFLKPVDPRALGELLGRYAARARELSPLTERIRAIRENALKIAEQTRQVIALSRETRQFVRECRKRVATPLGW
jgi:CheY-like chemotaxis protein